MKELLRSFNTIREIKVQGFIILSRSGSTFLRSRALSTPLVCSIVLPLTFVIWNRPTLLSFKDVLTIIATSSSSLAWFLSHLQMVSDFPLNQVKLPASFSKPMIHLLYFDLGFWIKSFKKFQSFTVSMETGSAPYFWHNILLSFQSGPWFCNM